MIVKLKIVKYIISSSKAVLMWKVGGRVMTGCSSFILYSWEKRETLKTAIYICVYIYMKVLELFELFELLERHALQITFLTFPVIQQLHFSQLMSPSGPAEVTGHIRITLDRRYVWI